MHGPAFLFVLLLAILPAFGVVWTLRCLRTRRGSLRELLLIVAYWGAVSALYATFARW